jgi:putative phage-type endonuclease
VVSLWSSARKAPHAAATTEGLKPVPIKIDNTQEEYVSQDRTEWLAERRKGIGGSDIGSILGVNPYKSKRDLALEKLGLMPEQEETAPMKRGTCLEPIIADIFSETTGIEVVEEKQILVHPDHPWMLGNIDRWTTPDKAVLEIKAPGIAVFSKIRREGLPTAWISQLQWYLSITGSEAGFFAVFNSELWKLEHFQVESDRELQALMIDEAGKFWSDLQQGIIPEDNAPSIELPPTTGNTIKIDTAEWSIAVRELYEAQEIRKEAEALEETAKAEIKRIMGDTYCAESDGFRAYLINQNGRKTVDSKRLEKQFPEAYAACAKAGKPFQKFTTYFLKGFES